MRINAIAAMGKNRQIGLKGKLPWKNSDELYHFQEITDGGILIMGRKTYESIKSPLVNRRIIVVSSKNGQNSKNTFFVKTPQEAVELAKFIKNDNDFCDVWICGGAKIYEQLIPYVHTFILSHVDYEGKADTYLLEFEQNFHCYRMEHERGDNFKVFFYERVK